MEHLIPRVEVLVSFQIPLPTCTSHLEELGWQGEAGAGRKEEGASQHPPQHRPVIDRQDPDLKQEPAGSFSHRTESHVICEPLHTCPLRLVQSLPLSDRELSRQFCPSRRVDLHFKHKTVLNVLSSIVNILDIV